MNAPIVCISSAVVALMLCAATANASVVVNGSFEDTSVSSPSPGKVNNNLIGDLRETGGGGSDTWDVYDQILGWSTADGSGIEIQTNATLGSIDAQEGARYVELDSHSGGISNSTMLSSAIALTAGKYELSFFYSPRVEDVNTNGIAYEVLGASPALTGEVTGPGATTQVGVWTEIKAYFTVDVDKSVQIQFSAFQEEDTLGGLIDNVSISVVPLPFAGLLMLTALGGAAAAYRKRKSA